MTSPDRHAHPGQVHFLTFSCYKRRRLLDTSPAAWIVARILTSQLAKQHGRCQGFVIMPDHVHALVWLPEQGQLSTFMKQWKQRSPVKIKKNLKEFRKNYLGSISPADPVWQAGYYSFNIQSNRKLRDKLHYMHFNPVKAGLARTQEEWGFSSARYYVSGMDVGVPIEQPGGNRLLLRNPDNKLSGPPGESLII